MNATHAKAFFLWALLFFLLKTGLLHAQSAKDSAHVKVQVARLDSANKALDALHRWCNATYTSPNYLRTMCPTVKQRPDLRARRAENSLLLAPPVVQPPTPPNNQKPKAAFTVSWSGDIVTLDGSSSSDDQQVVVYEWRSEPARVLKSGSIVTRDWRGTAWTEWLKTCDAAGLCDSTFRQILGPPTPTPPPTQPPIDTQPPTQPPPSSGTVELPRAVPESKDPYPGRPCDIQVTATGLGANVPAALQQAAATPALRVVCLANSSSSGVVQFPARAAGDTGWIKVRAASVATPFGVRVTPSTATGMPRLATNANGQSFSFAASTHHWFIEGLEFTVGPAVTLTFALIDIGTLTATTVAQQPHHIILRGNWIHGSATAAVRRCIAVHSASTAFVDNYIDDCHERGADSQAIHGANGPGPYLLDNNHLAGAGENVMFGGSDPKIPGLVPSDITIRRNHFFTPIAWKGVWTRKNHLETKNAARVLVEANVFDGSWHDPAGGQGGMSILLRSINQDGGCRWCRTTDVTIRRNLIRNAGGGIGITAGWTATDTTSRRILVTENVFDGLAMAPYTANTGTAALHLSGPGRAQSITFDRNIATGNPFQAIRLDSADPATGVVFRDLVLARGLHGIGSDGHFEGEAGLTAGAPGFQWINVTMLAAQRTGYPAGTLWATVEPPLAAQIRAIVQQATAGVDKP